MTANILCSLLAACAFQPQRDANSSCQSDRVSLQMLGTAGPELTGGDRASSSYLLWVDDKARVLIDTGPGSVQRFRQTDARFEDIDAILYSHFHSDHSADFSSYAKGAFFTQRQKDLHVFGPSASTAKQPLTVSAIEFVDRNIGKNGIYPYLSSYLEAGAPWQIIPHTLTWDSKERRISVTESVADDLSLSSISVEHGPLPALAWRIDVAGCSLSFSGDMSGASGNLPTLIKGSDILVAHNAIPETERGVGAYLHMKPSMIAQLAEDAGVEHLFLTHRMQRSADTTATRKLIRSIYRGHLEFPDDLDIYSP